MVKIKGIAYYVGPPLGKPWRVPINLPLKDGGSLARKFREGLLKNQNIFTVVMDMAGCPRLNCNFARCGEAAGVALWWRGGVTEALTAYLPGLGVDDEDIVEQALAAKPYPITLCHWHKVLQAERPLCVNFLLTRTAGEDRFLAAAASALAFSYFSILGVTED